VKFNQNNHVNTLSTERKIGLLWTQHSTYNAQYCDYRTLKKDREKNSITGQETAREN